MYCSNCGKEIADDVKFCPSCGIQTSKETKQIKNQSKNDDSNIGIMPIIGIVVFIAILFVLFSSGGSKTTSEPWQAREIHQVSDTMEDFIITHEATGVIKSRNIACNGDCYKVIVDEDLWNSSDMNSQRNLLRYALDKYTKEKALPKAQIIRNDTGMDFSF